MESSLPIWADSQFSNPFATDSIFKDSLILETRRKVSRSSLNASAIKNSHKPRLVPATTHPLSQQAPNSPDISNNVHNASPDFKREQSHTTLCSESDFRSLFKAQGQNVFKKRRSLSGSDVIANSHGDGIESERKKMVIVHVVKPSDTIAGVALFYGIELAILKRENKLWTNDSIHLRKNLYIPLEHCKITADKADMMVQENHMVVMNHSSTLESSRPSASSSTTSYNGSNNNINHVRDLPGASTSTVWSSPSSTSSSLSNLNGTIASNYTNYTRAEIQLPPAQLYANSNPILHSTSPSPIPVTYLSKNDSIVDKLFSSLGSASEKYRRRFGSVKREGKKTAWNNRRESSISLTKKRV